MYRREYFEFTKKEVFKLALVDYSLIFDQLVYHFSKILQFIPFHDCLDFVVVFPIVPISFQRVDFSFHSILLLRVFQLGHDAWMRLTALFFLIMATIIHVPAYWGPIAFVEAEEA